ncbi:ribonuclease HII [Johnsonella ignava]|mgnify:FL=1|nr:ribonuclease HII [Johnsonella ignava]
MKRRITEKLLESEHERLKQMHEFEEKYDEYSCICGIDEAGRGPLAGPVVAACVILPKDTEILFLNDSKKVTKKRRLELFEEICYKAVDIGVGIIDENRIDDINILNATYEAMQKAIVKMDTEPDILLVDAVRIPDIGIKQISIIQGDARSVSIAAASIIAKVTRDKLMIEYDEQYPEYGFAKHKGYGTTEHIAAIRRHGACPIHRKSFVDKFFD